LGEIEENCWNITLLIESHHRPSCAICLTLVCAVGRSTQKPKDRPGQKSLCEKKMRPKLLPLLLCILLISFVSKSDTQSTLTCIEAASLNLPPLCVGVSSQPCSQFFQLNITVGPAVISQTTISSGSNTPVCTNLDPAGVCTSCLDFSSLTITPAYARVCPVVTQRCAGIQLARTPLTCTVLGTLCSGTDCKSCTSIRNCGWYVFCPL